MGKPKILIVSDSPAIDTGMGVAHKEIATRLYMSGKYEICSFGWFWLSAEERGIKWEFPWKQYTSDDQRHPYGHPNGWNNDYDNPQGDFENSPFNKVIKEFKPDLVIAIGDVWMCDFIYFLPTRNSFKLIHEFPIDGEPVPRSWVSLVKKADLPVVMSDYGLKVCREVDPYLYIEKIPRGVNTQTFRPLPDKKKIREKCLPSTEDKFVIGVFDRYQDRKQIPKSIEAFVKFKKMHKSDNCDLYLHMDLNDGHSMQQNKNLIGENGIITRYNIAKNVLVNKEVTVEKGVSVEELVKLYNCCDVKMSSTQGEGFGLTTLEAMSCGVPCIATNYTTMPELLGEGRGLTAKVAAFLTGQYNVERAIVDTSDLARCLEVMYRSNSLREIMSEKSREYALTRDWGIVISQWFRAIDTLLEPREYKLITSAPSIYFDRDIQEINIQGAIYEHTGFSIVTDGFAKGLNKLGHKVSITPRIDKPEGYEVDDEIKQLIENPTNNDIEIINHMPDECVRRVGESTARIKIAYSPWELTEVKDEWIDMINRDVYAFWCNSNFVKDIFIKNGACPEKIAVIPNGITINTESEPSELKTKKRYKFLMVGNLGDVRKNISTLIQAYQAAFTNEDDVCLVLKSRPGNVGSDPTETVENLARSYKNPPEIEIIHDDRDDLSGIYKACDCFVTASHAEGFCQPILDALSVGMLIIAPNHGGYVDFADKCERFAGLPGKMVSSENCPVHLPDAKWCDIDFDNLVSAMKNSFSTNMVRNGKNYVPEYTWENSAKKIVEEIKKISKRPNATKVYYENFSKNMWNDDNRQNIMRYASSDIEFVDNPEEASFQILDIAKLSDFNNVRCSRHIINFHCFGEWSEENKEDYRPFLERAIMVYSHLDLDKEVPGLNNFVRGPWGVSHRRFFKQIDNIHKYIILNTGMVPETEGIYESVAAADAVGKGLIHTGPNLNLRNKSYTVCKNFLNTDQLRYMYHSSSYTSGMRRIEGFEKTVAEGLFCGSRPICFDTELYRYWYGNLVEYVREGTPEETASDLKRIFSGEYREVTEVERSIAKRSFAWMNVAPEYWKSIKKLNGGNDGGK